MIFLQQSVLIYFIGSVAGLSTEKIPFCGTPPRSKLFSSSIYDPILNRIITIGGTDVISNEQKPFIHAFSLDTFEFEKIYKLSDYEPQAYTGHSMFLRDDRKILVFGYTSGITSFNLINNAWKEEDMSGDYLSNLSGFAFSSFIFNNIQFVAIFGGSTETGLNTDLYL